MKYQRVAALVSMLVSAASAQGQQVPADQLAEVQVTGSRIQQTGMTTPTPVTAVSAVELTTLSPGTLAEGLAQLPQFFGSTTTASTGGFFSSPGAGNLNLRGLGTGNTLMNVFAPNSTLTNNVTITGAAATTGVCAR